MLCIMPNPPCGIVELQVPQRPNVKSEFATQALILFEVGAYAKRGLAEQE
jgi:hypothetical protein